LSDILIQHGRLVADFRVLAPHVVWLLSVLQAEQLYVFSGDEVQIHWVILRGKMASIYQYSERLQQQAADHSASEEDTLAQGVAQMVGMSEGEDISGQDLYDGDQR
jgi:nitroimidazol reductase NimA-like FMN-containing flavoprotein (pyridoxamine 5'-phosphate oxidase superfamily)